MAWEERHTSSPNTKKMSRWASFFGVCLVLPPSESVVNSFIQERQSRLNSSFLKRRSRPYGFSRFDRKGGGLDGCSTEEYGWYIISMIFT
eukprot:scaffold1953_cov176-Amphora_coffeaeformis.AAC.22